MGDGLFIVLAALALVAATLALLVAEILGDENEDHPE